MNFQGWGLAGWGVGVLESLITMATLESPQDYICFRKKTQPHLSLIFIGRVCIEVVQLHLVLVWVIFIGVMNH